MKRKLLLASVLILVGLGLVASQVFDGLSLRLTGLQEVPALSTQASADMHIRVFNAPNPNVITTDDPRIEYELFYQNLEGSITQAHIHIGQKGVNGGISLWLCTTPAITAPPGTQLCPPSPGAIRGTLRANNVVGPAGQGIDPGEFNEVLRMMQEGKTYANVHSTKFPGGEVRAQIVDNRIINGAAEEEVHKH